VALGLVAFYFLIPSGEERLHIILFSLMGYFSPALWFPLAVGVGDEIIQMYVPDRFFYLRDIAINCLSAACGYWVRIKR
jgi:VanZ family protein